MLLCVIQLHCDNVEIARLQSDSWSNTDGHFTDGQTTRHIYRVFPQRRSNACTGGPEVSTTQSKYTQIVLRSFYCYII